MRIGSGYDIHRMVAGRPLILGGVRIESEKGEEAHSDGDVLIHALIDALLGAAACGDIGSHFPPSDSKWKDADSRDLLKAVLVVTPRLMFPVPSSTVGSWPLEQAVRPRKTAVPIMKFRMFMIFINQI